MIKSDMTNEAYHAHRAVSCSQLKTISKKSLKHSLVPFGSAAMDLGTATHTAILEPHKLDREVVEMPKFDKRTKAGKFAHAEFVAINEGKICLAPEDMYKVFKMRDSVYGNSEYANLLGAFDAQVEYSAFSEIDGQEVRCRPDWYSPSNSLMIDLKTTRDANPKRFKRDFFQYGYDLQESFYRHVWQEAGGGDVDQYIFINVESSEPFDFIVNDISATQRSRAFQKCLDALSKLKEARETGVYAGYSKELMTFEEVFYD